MRIINRIKHTGQVLSNILSNRNADLSYIVEIAGWSIKEDGRYISKHINSKGSLKARISTSIYGIRNQIVHFGSNDLLIKDNGFSKPHASNKAVLTWFHVVPGLKKNKKILDIMDDLCFIHTSCLSTRLALVELGVPQEKIVCIPLGIELALFKQASLDEKLLFRKKFGIPEQALVIGSFQKDGVGFDDGLEPKFIKGPDIFLNVIEKLSKKHPVFVFLAGPARGYIKKGLERINVPYISKYQPNFINVGQYYKLLDLYLITSRIEGGPKQILESWASGVPLISTKVGMVPDISQDGINVLLNEIEDVDGLVHNAERVLCDSALKQNMINNALEEVKKYSWSNISQSYFVNIYSKLV